MTTTASPVYLYILMRTDVPTMNPGKAVAQGSHAANQCIHEGRNKALDSLGTAKEDEGIALEAMINEWEQQTPQGFGTCIVLGVNEAQMFDAVWGAQSMGVHAGITHDPTYPTATPEKPGLWFGGVAMAQFLWATGVMMMPLAFWLRGQQVTNQPALMLLYGVALFLAVAGWFTLIVGLAAAHRRDRFDAETPATIPLDTCAYVFGRKEDCLPFVGDFRLMR